MSVTDVLRVDLGIVADPAYDRAYTQATGLADVADLGEGNHYWLTQSGSQIDYAYGPFNPMPRSVRTVCNGDKLAWLQYGTAGSSDVFITIDGVPVSMSPFMTGTGALFHQIIFKSPRRRVIGFRTPAGIGGIYTSKPYDLFKPPPRKGPRLLILGDSWSTSAGCLACMNAIYYNIGLLIGSEDVWIDGYGGTGYSVGTGVGGVDPNSYYHRVNTNLELTGQTWDIEEIDPDIVVVHGGGANDKFKGKTNQEAIDGIALVLTRLRARLPNAKIVFVEGFSPPMFTPAVYNPNYIAIRQGVQAAVPAVGAYYIDVATTRPWIYGIGDIQNPNVDGGNANVYFHNADRAHGIDAMHQFVRREMANRLNQVIADRGALVNTLIKAA